MTTAPRVEQFSRKAARHQYMLTLNIDFHEILWIRFRATLAIKILSHTQTQRQILSRNIRKSCSRQPKAYKSIKNWKSKIFTKPIFFFIYIEESIVFVQIFDFRFLMYLHVLGCPKHDLTISEKSLSLTLSLYVCMSD